MPELPEVETTIRGLKPLLGLAIFNVKIHTPKLRIFIPKNITLIKTEVKIQEIKRVGKFIIFHLSNKYCIVIHLGMSGRLQIINLKGFIKKTHDHFILRTNKEYLLVYNDPRKFGLIDYDTFEKIYARAYILNLGKEALSKSLNGHWLFSKISKTSVPIKQILLNQSIIAGIGNIYASEILFDAKISPFQRGMDLNIQQCSRISISTKKILKKAINLGGSTLKNYVSANGMVGNFQNNFKVYNRLGEKINGKIIIKIFQYGRSTYYCPDIQKIQN
jgi:formamidopyrimidine-DNA glycosylase